MPVHGQQMGCNESEPPRDSTNQQLSRIYDMLTLAVEVGGSELRMNVWNTLPGPLKMDYIWSKWIYVKAM